MEIDRPIVIAVMLLAVLLLVFFLVMPQYGTFKNLNNTLAKKKAEYTAQHDYYAAIEKLYADLQDRKEDMAKIDDALPTNPDTGRLIYYLQQISAENGIIVKSLFVSKTAQAVQSSKTSAKGGQTLKGVGNITFSLNIVADYEALGNFLAALENSDRIFEVTSISFGSSTGSGQTTQASSQTQQFANQDSFNFSLQLKTYSY